jgi:hypothetical protein
MEYGNGRATMIELDMVYVSYFGDFLTENLSNKIFCLGLVRQEKPPGRPEKPAGPAWPLRNTAGTYISTPACEHWE